MFNPKPDDYPGRKELPGGGEYDRTDPLVRGAGIGRSGIKNNILDRGKRKGLPSRDQITSLKQSIKDISGRHTRANLPKESVNEFAADDGDSGGEDDALHKYARMWWAGDEATQMQIEKVLARMGWEIGEDEGGYDNGGVFVVRAGDVNGDSYESWAAEDLTEQGVAEGLNEFAPDGFNGGDDGEGFSTEIAKMAQEDGFTKGVSLADGATTERAMTINHWHSQHGGIYKQYFAKGFKAGRMNKVKHDNRQYNLNLKLMKDGSIRHSEQGVAEGSDDPFGPQGRFVGDTGPAQISATVSRVPLRIGDRVLYKPTEQHARIVGLSQDSTQARIEISTPMGGRVFNCKTSDLKQTGRGVAEVAPPGAKAERMVKHIKAGYAKDGKLTPKEKSIAYATAWKSHNKGMAEGFAIMLANATSRDDLRQIRNFVTEHVTDKNKQRQIMEQATRIVAVQRRKYAAMSAK
jgi:hypothetical protein